MFNAPDYRISEIVAKPGDTVVAGDVVAKATPVAARPDGGSAPVEIHSMAAGLVLADRSCGIGVPQSAVRESSNGPRLQVVERGAVVTRNVSLGLVRDGEVEVTAGLHEGDLIVANAGASLHDGDRVTPVAAEDQDAP